MEDNIGNVLRIDCIDLNINSRRVFVHFTEWYSNKGYALIAKSQLEEHGFFAISIPNKKNKNKPYFDTKILINKNPISHAEYKIKKFYKIIEDQKLRIDVLESKVLLLEEGLICYEKSLAKFYDIDMDMNMPYMNESELDC